MFFVLAALGSLGFASRPKSAVADFVEPVGRSPNPIRHKKGPTRGPFLWRTGWDSNPRSPCRLAAFRVRCHRPLDHLSTGRNIEASRRRQAVLRPRFLPPMSSPAEHCVSNARGRRPRCSPNIILKVPVTVLLELFRIEMMQITSLILTMAGPPSRSWRM
jgi:hypothetical protein